MLKFNLEGFAGAFVTTEYDTENCENSPILVHFASNKEPINLDQLDNLFYSELTQNDIDAFYYYLKYDANPE